MVSTTSLTPAFSVWLAGSTGRILDRRQSGSGHRLPARHIDPRRDRPHAQKVIGCGPQELNASLSGKPGVMILLATQDRHTVMNGPCEVIGGRHDQT